METIKVVLNKTKTTPGAVRYDNPEREGAAITSLYVRKAELGSKVPDSIRVTVEDASE